MEINNSNIKYKYAFDENQNLVCIDNVTKEERELHTYRCISCGKILIARLGEKRTKHFAHKSSEDSNGCNKESYLHNLGKLLIKRKFDANDTFNISYEKYCNCHHKAECPSFDSEVCKATYTHTLNLKKRYTQCDCEKKIGDYVADLLVSSEQTGIPEILIEIKYTHSCTESKINSGYQIIEISVESEEDLLKIVDNDLCENQSIVFYGFNRDGKNQLATYAQQKFRNIFTSSDEFIIKLDKHLSCHKAKHCPFYESHSCSETNKRPYNLKEFYDCCETTINDSIEESTLILTKSDKADRDPIVVDFCCTKRCLLGNNSTRERTIKLCFDSPKKMNRILSNCLTENNNEIIFYNFQKSDENEHASNVERTDINYFYLYESGRAHIDWSSDNYSCKTMELYQDSHEIFRLAFVNEKYSRDAVYQICYYLALKNGIKFKSCSICKYRREPFDTYRILGENFCCMSKKLGTNPYPKSSDANSCGYYTINKQLIEDVEKALETFKFSILKK